MDDVKTYTAKEAQIEWDGAREAKRRMFLARVDKRDSDWALKSWAEFDSVEKKMVHQALNEDFYSPAWYVNTKGTQIFRLAPVVVQKSQAQRDDEEGAEKWEAMKPNERFSALLANGIGADADAGKFSQWSNLSRELRIKLVVHFRAADSLRLDSSQGKPVHTARRLENGVTQLALF